MTFWGKPLKRYATVARMVAAGAAAPARAAASDPMPSFNGTVFAVA